ncbi:MAG: PadR family transcriptional regulator [Planctomycetota bacterium]
MAPKDIPPRETPEIGLVELRRGVLVLAVLSRLRAKQYGYSLRQALAEGGMPIEEGTLYPLLRRLEGQGLLLSEWDTGTAPPRRYYRLSPEGERAYAELADAWRAQTEVIRGFLESER